MPTKLPPVQRRVVGYVRISRFREDQTSIRTQIAAITAYCLAHGWLLVDIIEEPGRSAFKDTRGSRPGFKKAMSMIAGGAADTFVVWKVDRAARNALDLLKFVREDLEKYGARFVSVTESFDTTTAMGRAMMTIVVALAELESAQKQERTLEWHGDRREHGMIPTGRTALGYVKVKGKDGKPTLTHDKTVAPLIQEAARRLIGGKSAQSTWKWINDQGVAISRPGLLTSLQSPTMAGLICMEPLEIRNGQRIVPQGAKLKEGGWTPILDRETWDQVRTILRDPLRRTSLSPALAHPLRPIMRCHCGGVMPVAPDKRKTKMHRYVCSHCRNGIVKSAVDDYVYSEVLGKLGDPEWRAMRATGTPTGPDPAVVEARLAELWQSYLRGGPGSVTLEQYEEAKAVWHGEIAAAQTGEHNLPDVESVRDAWPTFTVMEKHVVLRRAIESLTIAPSVKRGNRVDMDRVDLVLIR